jgi:hypothetical protein
MTAPSFHQKEVAHNGAAIGILVAPCWPFRCSVGGPVTPGKFLNFCWKELPITLGWLLVNLDWIEKPLGD